MTRLTSGARCRWDQVRHPAGEIKQRRQRNTKQIPRAVKHNTLHLATSRDKLPALLTSSVSDHMGFTSLADIDVSLHFHTSRLV